jgi:hypothetical protein
VDFERGVNMTLAEQFLNELKLLDSEGKLVGIKVFHEIILKNKGYQVNGAIEFEDESQAYYDLNISEWVWILKK